MLPVAAIQVLAMVLHELATNAAKYGALSTPHGRVEVNWKRGLGQDAANLSIAWREVGGPEVAPAPNFRYGVSIIRDLIPQELGGFVDLAFASSGICCNIEIPLEPARDTPRPSPASENGCPEFDPTETGLPGWAYRTRSAPGGRQGVGGASPLR
jgi:two-component sensor histidine kinase